MVRGQRCRFQLALILEGGSGGRKPHRYGAPHENLVSGTMLRKEAKATIGTQDYSRRVCITSVK